MYIYQAVNRFAADGWGAALDVRRYSLLLRWPASFVLPSVRRIKQDRLLAQAKLAPILQERLKKTKDSAYKAPDDGIQWLLDAAGPGLSIEILADTVIRIMMAAVHTTAHTSTVALIDLLTHKEYIPELRQEIIEHSYIKHGEYVQIAHENLRKMESFVKESMRFTPLSLANTGRKAQKSFGFHDGTTIPQGYSTFVATEAMYQDPEIYPDSSKFDGLRFHRLRQKGASENTKWRLGNSIEESTSFGYGAQACPGRWLAAKEVLLMLSKLLLEYEVEWSPRSSDAMLQRYHEKTLMPPDRFFMRIKRRINRGKSESMLQYN